MRKLEKQKRIRKWIPVGLMVLCFAVSYGVYRWQEGLCPGDALYYALCLFPMGMRDVVVDGEPKAVSQAIMILRILCPVSASVVLLSLLTSWINWLTEFFRSLRGGAVIVYGTNEIAELTAAQNHFIDGGLRFQRFAAHQIILMDTDTESIAFYQDHAKELEGKQVYIGLREMASALMRGQQAVHYFNIQEEIARDYWKKTDLWEGQAHQGRRRLVILNYRHGGLGCYLLRQGLMNNIFPDDRAVSYAVFGEKQDLGLGFENLERMNEDNLTWYDTPWQENLEVLRSADRIILAEGVSPQILNQLIDLCTTQRIDYYTPSRIPYPGEYRYPLLREFGITEEILNRESILKDGLFRDAKRIHYGYLCQYGSWEELRQITEARQKGTEDQLIDHFWAQLDGFTKNSNVARADYLRFRGGETSDDLEAEAKAEHIRWSRFHLLNGWRYGVPANGARKDPKERIHQDLVPWEELPEGERKKDMQQVEMELRQKV